MLAQAVVIGKTTMLNHQALVVPLLSQPLVDGKVAAMVE
jgi:hypothetical protein